MRILRCLLAGKSDDGPNSRYVGAKLSFTV